MVLPSHLIRLSMPPMRITKRLFVFVFYFAVQRYDLFRICANFRLKIINYCAKTAE